MVDGRIVFEGWRPHFPFRHRLDILDGSQHNHRPALAGPHMDTLNDLAAVESLLIDRDALHGWLEKLDAAGSTVPAPVRARVRDDYERRLDELTEQLRAHADTIAAKLEEDRREHLELSASATAAREALAEAELRFAVGEYDQQRFDHERTNHASDLETYVLSLDAVGDRIARLEGVHGLVSRAPRAPESTPDAPVFHEPVTAAPTDLEAELSQAFDLAEADTGDDPPAIGIGDLAPDDADQLLAIFDDAGSLGAHDDDRGPLSFRPSVGTPIHAPTHTPMRAGGTRHRTQPAAAARRGCGARRRAVRRRDCRLRSDPRPGPGPAASRTVRCAECGAMNKPMEWYCEKCGAELTVV